MTGAAEHAIKVYGNTDQQTAGPNGAIKVNPVINGGKNKSNKRNNEKNKNNNNKSRGGKKNKRNTRSKKFRGGK